MIQLLWTQMVRWEINGWTKISHVSIGLQAIKWPHHSTLSKEIVCWIMPYQKIKIYLWRYLIHHSFIYNNVKYMLIQFSSVQLLSHVRLCDPMNCSMPGLPVHHQLPEFTQTRVHGVGDAIQPSHPLSSPSPRAFNLSQHQGLFRWVGSSYQEPERLGPGKCRQPRAGHG